MKLWLIPIALCAAACTSVPPDDFPPPPPGTVIVERPVYTQTVAVPPRLKPITSTDLSEAANLLYLLKTMIAAGDSGGVAQRVAYPIVIVLDGQITVIQDAAGFEQEYDRIVNQSIIDAISAADEDDLLYTFGGIRVGDGRLWFNQYCADPACSEGELKISEINP